MALNIIYEDATLQVVDKPAGMDMEEIQALLAPGSAPAHRLDKDTSGVLLVAKDETTLQFLQEQFKERKTEKTYLCLVQGNPKQEEGVIATLVSRSPNDRRKQKAFFKGEPGAEGKREAVTAYRVQEHYRGYAFLEVKPRTGRKHQIRVHLSHLGHPVAGDKLYGFKNQRIPEGLKRQFLHASSLAVMLPDKTKKTFSSPLPEELQAVLKQLERI